MAISSAGPARQELTTSGLLCDPELRLKLFCGTLHHGRIEEQREARFALRENTDVYSSDFAPEKVVLSQENTYYWDTSPTITAI